MNVVVVEKNSMASWILAHRITKSFEHCEMDGHDVCEACEKNIKDINKEIIASAVEVEWKDKDTFVLPTDAKIQVQLDRSQLLGKGGFSKVYAAKKVCDLEAFPTRTPDSTYSRWDGYRWEEDPSLVLKTSAAYGEQLRSIFIDHIIGQEVRKHIRCHFHLDMMANIVGPIIKVPHEGIYPPFQLGMVIRRYNTDLFTLINSDMICDRDMMYVLASLASLLGAVQKSCRFMHRDLKVENVFCYMLPQKQDIVVPSPCGKYNITFPNMWFKIVIADFGLASIRPDKKRRVAADWWKTAKSAAELNKSFDLCMFMMTVLASLQKDLGHYMPLSYDVMWECCRNDLVRKGIYAMRMDEDENVLSDESLDDANMQDLADAIDLAMDQNSVNSYNQAMYSVAARMQDEPLLWPENVFKHIHQHSLNAEALGTDSKFASIFTPGLVHWSLKPSCDCDYSDSDSEAEMDDVDIEDVEDVDGMGIV